jgi:hypothetical protein
VVVVVDVLFLVVEEQVATEQEQDYQSLLEQHTQLQLVLVEQVELALLRAVLLDFLAEIQFLAP